MVKPDDRKIYALTCGKIDATTECFLLAGCYKEVAEAYAKDDMISNCLSVCKEGYAKITYFLPKKFVCDLLRKRKNKKLNLDPEVVAEAFMSIDDPLLILSSENVSPEIDAPCAIFVDLRKSKEEIESVLFPRINTLNVHTSSNNAGSIPELSSSNTLPDAYMNMNTVKLQMNWKVLEEISNAINRKGVEPNKLSVAPMIKLKNIVLPKMQQL
uniref:UvrD-like helicase, ATP-binding domain, P-loop containing nucleoside triphosphate hydrolase n=1 Tax=Tanacetum cinerariifolium TaxID=118510 RepID=A0A6L2L5N9_TANCI|nr:UvrD-like helicase, ATP-binding domain, P-loop containing nucleoside triphosphate hydrolase [Tanacetum cinerariifolium]